MEWSLLAGLDEDVRREVVAACRRRRFRRGEVVFHEGDPGDSLFLVTSGRVAIQQTTRLGDVVILALYGPGEAFGEMALLREDRSRTATAVAARPTELLALHRRDFAALRDREPSVDRLLLEALGARVERLTGHLIEALHQPADTRLARRLLDLFDRFGQDAATVEVAITQDDLASMAGTTRPTANRVLRALEDAGVITIGRGRLTLLDRAGLDRRARG